MTDAFRLFVNGQERTLGLLPASTSLADVLQALALRADRIAVELNGELAPRGTWQDLQVHPGDKLEVVHFVGGGTASSFRARRPPSNSTHLSP